MNYGLKEYVIKTIAAVMVGFLLIAGVALDEKGDMDHQAQSSALPETEAVNTANGSVMNTEAAKEATGAVTETEEESEISEPVITTLTLTATGDCTLGPEYHQSYDGSFAAYYDSYGPEYFFENCRDIFESDDLTLINLECVLSDSTDRVDKTFNLEGKPEYVQIMTSSSVEAVSLGNNHSEDFGAQSRTDTENVLDENGIVWALDDTVGYYTTEEGIKVGIVSELIITYTEEREQILMDGIQTARDNGANLVVVCCHWGIEKNYYPETYQQELAHRLIDAGADLVIGNHPHVLQGVEVYNGKVICYSLGNFCFGGNKNPFDYKTMIYQQTFTFSDGVLQSNLDASIIPYFVSSATGYNNFQPTAAVDSKQTIIDKVNELSASYSEVSFDSDGKLLYAATGETAEEAAAATAEETTGN